MTLVLAVKSQAAVVTQGYAEVLARINTFRRNAFADSGGEATIIIPGIEVASLPRFLVYESFKVLCNGSASTPNITVYEGSEAPENFIGGSDRGDLNEWVELPSLYTTDPIIIKWTGADEGANCTVRVQSREIHLVPVRI